LEKTDEELFKFNKDEKGIQVIGFTDSYKVPRHHFIGTSDIIIPNPTSEKDKVAFTALIQAMISMNKVIIARYAPRKNSEPKLSVLSPYIGSKGAVLYLNSLPTIEDIRDYQFESLKECTQKQEEVISKFIDSLDLNKAYLDEDSNPIETLKPSETFNPVLQHFYHCLEFRALNSDNKSLPNLDEKIANYLRPDINLFENNKYSKVLNKFFTIKEIDQPKDKKKRIFWREIIQTEIKENTGISDKKSSRKKSTKTKTIIKRIFLLYIQLKILKK